MYDYQTMICQSRDGVFSAWFELKDLLKESELLKLFILISKHFPNYYFISDDFIYEKMEWEDYVLTHFIYRSNSFNNIYFVSKVYVQDQNDVLIMIEPEDVSIEIIYGSDDGAPVFGVQLYPYVYFDKNIVYFGKDNIFHDNFKIVDQSVAAKKNRLILSEFLKNLEKLLNTNISYFQGGKKCSDKYVYKYGIREDAVLSV